MIFFYGIAYGKEYSRCLQATNKCCCSYDMEDYIFSFRTKTVAQGRKKFLSINNFIRFSPHRNKISLIPVAVRSTEKVICKERKIFAGCRVAYKKCGLVWNFDDLYFRCKLKIFMVL